MSLLRRPDGDDIAKIYGKYMTCTEFAELIANQEVKVLCHNGLHTAIVLDYDVSTGNGCLRISKTLEEYCGSFEMLYIAQPRKLIRKSLSCPERDVAVVTAEKKPKIDTELFSPCQVSFSMNAVSPSATPGHSWVAPTPAIVQCDVCKANLGGHSALEQEVHISTCTYGTVCAQEWNSNTAEDTQVIWEEYDKQSVNDEDCCLICNDNLSGLTELERNQHMLKCCMALQEIENGLEPSEEVNEEKYFFLTQPQPEYHHCPPPSSNTYNYPSSSSSSSAYSSSVRDVGAPVVCNVVTAYTASSNSTAPSVVDVKPVRSPASNTKAPVVVNEERGFMCKVFYCVICDLDLSKKQLSNRFQHMKQCAKAHHIDTKVLMTMIAPEEGMDGGLLEMEEQEEQAKGDWRFMMNPPSGPTSSKSAAAVVVVEGEEGLVPIGAGLDKKGKRKSTGKKSDGTTGAGSEEGGAASSTASSTSVKNGKAGSSSSTKKGYWGSWKKSTDKPNTGYAPAYKKIQIGGMTVPIVVDGFQYACPQLSNCYFLTHFHSDHYMGLEKDFNAGTIYCSPTTAALVQMKLRVNAAHLVCLELEKRYVIEVGGVKVEVTLLEANHCPGAACILFAFSNGKLVLHTGDFRWNGGTLLPLSPTYRALAATASTSNPRNLLVYLDTTYCEVGHNFPPQSSVIDQIVGAVREEASQQAGTLFVFGAYTIGKERVFMAAADELGMKVHVDTTRYKTMMTYDWAEREKDKLTTDPSASWVWVTDMGKINFNQLDSLKKRRPGCRRIVAFSPTGWTHTGGGGGGGWNGVKAKDKKESTSAVAVAAGTVASNKSSLHARHKDGNTIYSVSYSEHSSFPELVDFIRTFQPQRVIPTVNCSAEKVREQIELLKVASGMSSGATGGMNCANGDRSADVQRQVDLKHCEFK